MSYLRRTCGRLSEQVVRFQVPQALQTSSKKGELLIRGNFVQAYAERKVTIMSLIRYAEGQQRSGSIGATVYSHNRFGQYIRARSIPVNPQTDRQVNARNIARALAIAWQNTLTQAQRDGWETYASNLTWKNKLGEDVNLTGLNHYVRSNSPRLLLPGVLARIDDAPSIFTLATAELALSCTASEATQQISINFDDTQAWATEAGAFANFYHGIPKNPAIKFFNGPYRFTAVVLGSGPAVSPNVTSASWPIADGQRIWLRGRIGRADGRLSEFALTNFLCAA